MGNRALRKQVASLLKQKQIPTKLYRGKAPFERLKASSLRSYIIYLQLNIGNIVHDCDGFNHRIKGIPSKHNYQKRFKSYHSKDLNIHIRQKSGYCFQISEFVFEDGMSCGCGIPDIPKSREEIEKRYFEFWSNQIKEFDINSCIAYDISNVLACLNALNTNNHISDNNVILLKEFREKL